MYSAPMGSNISPQKIRGVLLALCVVDACIGNEVSKLELPPGEDLLVTF